MGELIPLAAIVVSGMLLFPVVTVMAIGRLRKMRREAPLPNEAGHTRLEAELQQTREELQRLNERVQFMESLLEKRPDPTLLQ